MTSILSYNVNGLRASARKGFFEWLEEYRPDVLCLQEIKMQDDQVPDEWRTASGYHSSWEYAEKKGYSGVSIFCKQEPLHVEHGCGIKAYDDEGRVLRVDFKDFSVMSVYVPSGSSGEHRQAIKDAFMPDFLDYLTELRKTMPNLIVCGDVNIAHTEIDIHNPKANAKNSGFLPHERAWMSELLASGFVDSFRIFHPEGDQYSWWSYRGRARENNKGWRLDYHLLTEPIADKCTGAAILKDVTFSDHCPVLVEMDYDLGN